MDKKQTLFMPGLGIDSTSSTATFIADIQTSVVRGRDRMIYLHDPQSANLSAHWGPIFDAIQAEVTAGRAQVMTVPAWWAAASARVPPL